MLTFYDLWCYGVTSLMYFTIRDYRLSIIKQHSQSSSLLNYDFIMQIYTTVSTSKSVVILFIIW